MTLIIVILLGSIAAVIFALVYKAKRDTKKQIQGLENQLAEVAAQHRISWSAQMISKHRAFAWCADKRLLFFTDAADEDGRNHFVDMSQVVLSRLIERTSSVAPAKGMSADKSIVAVAIELCFDREECIALPVYTEIEDGPIERKRLTDEAKRWLALIQPKG